MTTSATRPASVPDENQVRDALRVWLDANWDPDLDLATWRRRFVASGWAVPTWPQRWHGRDLPAWADRIVHEELAAAGAPGTPLGVAMNLAAPTLMDHGDDAQKERFLHPILTGEESWCQLFSEPGAGSDLAGCTTHAVLDGDQWIVNGQKVWNTSAHHADFGLLLARTDWSVPKHQGLTYLLLPMKQPGVEVRPLRQMNHHSSFNEVFLSDAVISKDWVVGGVGNGWTVAMTTLAHERRYGAVSRPRVHGDGRAVVQARREADEYFTTYSWYPQRAGRTDLLVEHAQRVGRAADPLVRQEIVKAIILERVSRWTANRALAARALGRSPGPEGSIGKLASSNVARQAARAHSLLAGARGQLAGADGFDATIAEILLSVPAQSIAGGTDEIQRNILGERILGLPREPNVDTGVAFRDVKKNL